MTVMFIAAAAAVVAGIIVVLVVGNRTQSKGGAEIAVSTESSVYTVAGDPSAPEDALIGTMPTVSFIAANVGQRPVRIVSFCIRAAGDRTYAPSTGRGMLPCQLAPGESVRLDFLSSTFVEGLKDEFAGTPTGFRAVFSDSDGREYMGGPYEVSFDERTVVPKS
jgi:hypothetical protein